MKSYSVPVITIDGPSGSGKGTIAQMLALDLNWNILDSGALYRTLAFFLHNENISLAQFSKIKEKIQKDFKVQFDPGSLAEPVRVIFKNEDITNKVRNEEIAKQTSILAADPIIRDFIRPCQREFAELPGLIADGRDMGTVIFPEAELKIFLTASLEERAKRRQQQLKRQGMKVNMRVLLEELEDRDRKDREREHSPLVAADDSVELDTTDIKPEGVIKKIKALPFFK